MTRAQAAAELARICEAQDRTTDDLLPHQFQAWIQALESLPYERGRAAVTRLIQTWSSTRFPPPGALSRVAQEMSLEGQPNAGAYSQDKPSAPYDHDRMRRTMMQHDRWLQMTEQEYMAELERLQATGAITIRGG